jgi:precorrin-6B methylase 1
MYVMNPTNPPREELVRAPTVLIPKLLIKRIAKLCRYRGEVTAFVIEALTREAERRETENKAK